MKFLLRSLGLFFITSASASLAATASVEQIDWGKLPDGRTAKLYTLKNRHGTTAKITDFGAVLTELHTPDRDGSFTNVVLGFDNLRQYVDNNTSFGATIGRVANRIAGAKFMLDGKEVRVTANSGSNQIHGGKVGFHRVLWDSRALPAAKGRAAAEFKYRAKDGEEGFPGNLEVTVTYTLTDDHELIIDYTATTDKPTPVNLTNHSFFNLAGHGDVLAHELEIRAKSYTPANEQLIPTGEIAPVKGTGLDFTKPTAIGARIKQYYPRPGGYDHNYVLDGKPGTRRLAARVVEPKSGRVMECYTTEPGVQLYTSNWTQPRRFGPSEYPPHAALCLETQHYPDSVNQPSFPSTILRPGETFRSTTSYKFSARK
ncbi:MAG: aldose epimerase family protein [Verrucomicrobiota bacterium]